MNKEHKYKDKDEYKDKAPREQLNHYGLLYFQNPDDSSIPSLTVDTSPTPSPLRNQISAKN